MLTPAEERIALGVIAAAQSRGLPREAAEAAIAVIYAECSGLVLWANDGGSTLLDAYLHRQLTDDERAIARQSLQHPHDEIGRDLDSMGLFQQRPMSGWGPPHELMDPETSTGKFYDGAGGNHGLVHVPGWQDLPPWEAGRRVQGSLDKDAHLYSDSAAVAAAIVDEYWDASADDLPWAEEQMMQFACSGAERAWGVAGQ